MREYLSAADDIVVVTVPGSKTNPGGDRGAISGSLVGGCTAALRRLHAATNLAAANPLIGRGRTPHSERVGLTVESAARGATLPAMCTCRRMEEPWHGRALRARVGVGRRPPLGLFMRGAAGSKQDD